MGKRPGSPVYDPNVNSATARHRTVRTSDGLELAVYEQGDPSATTVVLVHGYPDNHSVWDGVAEILTERYHVVRYDVRGCGDSEVPTTTAGYAMPQLAADLRSVIDATSPDEPVHLVAHDWGSIQSWAAVTDPAMRDRLRSYTSISGPSLDMAAVWLRATGKHPRAGLKQLLASYYILAFQLPRVPELAAKWGVLDKMVDYSANAGVPADRRRTARRPMKDLVNGLELYRANIRARLSRPEPQQATVPTQVIAPTLDAHVTVAMQTQAPAPYCTDLHWRTIDGNHWVVEEKPAEVAAAVVAFLDYAEGGTLPAELTR
ncbi:MAG: alpha/beta fold hydrolase [Aldersonia sp.]|nr:alpha/beta fold hydrolase [Aldersonia sp.]